MVGSLSDTGLDASLSLASGLERSTPSGPLCRLLDGPATHVVGDYRRVLRDWDWDMLPKTTIQRAYELAEAGDALDLASLKSKLNAEGYRQVDAHLEGRSVRTQLRALMEAARRRAGNLEPES